MSLAERAKAAVQADREAKEQSRLELITRRRAAGVQAVLARAEELGLDLTADQVVPMSLIAEERNEYTGSYYGTQLVAHPDANLDIIWFGRFEQVEGDVRINIRPSDELCYDLPPGRQPERNGYDGHYGLKSRMEVHDLVQLGLAIEQIEKARKLWNRKHPQSVQDYSVGDRVLVALGTPGPGTRDPKFLREVYGTVAGTENEHTLAVEFTITEDNLSDWYDLSPDMVVDPDKYEEMKEDLPPDVMTVGSKFTDYEIDPAWVVERAVR